MKNISYTTNLNGFYKKGHEKLSWVSYYIYMKNVLIINIIEILSKKINIIDF